MTTYLLIRHASNDFLGRALAGHLPGVVLNQAGKREAASLADRLQGCPIKAIYSSPLERAIETATPLALRLGLPVLQREGLIEIRMTGWSGKTMDELDRMASWRRWNSFRSSERAPNGELMLEVQARAVTELEELRHQHPDEMIALVSHGDVIRGALAHYAGIPLDLFQRVDIDPASVTVLSLADWGPRILCVNDTGRF